MALIKQWLSAATSILITINSVQAEPVDTVKKALNEIRPFSLQANSGFAFFQAGMNCYAKRLMRVTYFVQADGVLFFFNDKNGMCYITAIYTDKTPTAPVGQFCLIDSKHYNVLFKPEFIAAALAKTQAHNPAFAAFVTALDACFKPNTVLATEVIQKIRESRQLHPAWDRS